MAVVTGGLGLPEEGSLVAQGFGLSELDLNAMTAHLAGSGSLTGTITGDNATPAFLGGGEYRHPKREEPPRLVVNISANLHGWSTVTATAEAIDRWQPTDDFNFNIELLLELV